MNYKLTKTPTGTKAAKYLYQVIDENGNVISERKSNRDYVACTIYGGQFFGRIDLIGKGDHGRAIKYTHELIAKFSNESERIEWNKRAEKNGWENADAKLEKEKRDLTLLTTIAYLVTENQ